MSQNRLANETSPYLLQHKDNPVHWWPWGPEALAHAQSTGKPILLSVGYAACHWCHVMAHESFEDEGTAEVMNDLFVNIKVDREERPDIDAIYMGALHRLGEQGGWPLTMFLDPEAKPFWGGTYFPKTSKFGRPAFVEVLRSVEKIYREQPEKVSHNAELITSSLKDDDHTDSALLVNDALLRELTARMVRAIDPDHGGISGAPKFPQWSFFWLLWRGAIRYQNQNARGAVENTLIHICQGGIYDHLGGGFARYSVDERWLVPHFEKMLYDNALLVDLMTEVYRETQNSLFKQRIEETIAWLSREMLTDTGAFAASFDADSEGEEGKYYVWTAQEIGTLLDEEDANFFSSLYDITPAGNFEGNNIPNRLHRLEPLSNEEEKRAKRIRDTLLKERSKRIPPGRDDKQLADWNGLMIAALSYAAFVFDRPDWTELAEKAFQSVVKDMTIDGRLRHSMCQGRTSGSAVAPDYANMIWAALRLYQFTSESKYLDQAQQWTDAFHAHYWLPERGRYATTASDTTDVIVRLAPGTDDATPSANAIQFSNLITLATLTGDEAYREQAIMMAESFAGDIENNLIAHTGLLNAMIDIISPQHIVLVDGQDLTQLKEALVSISVPGAVQNIVGPNPSDERPTWAQDMTTKDGQATAYACLGPQCAPPVTKADALIGLLKTHRSVARTKQ